MLEVALFPTLRPVPGCPARTGLGACPSGASPSHGRHAAAVVPGVTGRSIRTAFSTAGSVTVTRRGWDASTWCCGRPAGRARGGSSTTRARRFPVVDRPTVEVRNAAVVVRVLRTPHYTFVDVTSRAGRCPIGHCPTSRTFDFWRGGARTRDPGPTRRPDEIAGPPRFAGFSRTTQPVSRLHRRYSSEPSSRAPAKPTCRPYSTASAALSGPGYKQDAGDRRSDP